MIQLQCIRGKQPRTKMWWILQFLNSCLFWSLGNISVLPASYELDCSIFASTLPDFLHSTSQSKIFCLKILSLRPRNLWMHETIQRKKIAISMMLGCLYLVYLKIYYNNLHFRSAWKNPYQQVWYANMLNKQQPRSRTKTGINIWMHFWN